MTHHLFSPRERQSVAVACAPDATPPSYKLEEELDGCTTLPFDLVLKRLTFKKGGTQESDDVEELKDIWCDIQPNSLAWLIVSEQARAVIDQHATENDRHAWMAVTICRGHAEARPYYILWFTEQQDTLNPEQSTYWPLTGQIIKPVLDKDKISKLAVFPYPSDYWKFPSLAFISAKIKAHIKKDGLIGFSFTDARVK